MAPRTGKRLQDRGRDAPTKGLLWTHHPAWGWRSRLVQGYLAHKKPHPPRTLGIPLGPYRRPMPRVLGDPRGVGVFLWARYPCKVTFSRDRPASVWVGHSVGISDALRTCDVWQRDRPTGVARDREIQGQKHAARMLRAACFCCSRHAAWDAHTSHARAS